MIATKETSPSSSEWELNGNYWLYKKSLEKSDNDDRDYRLIKLASNDLEVLLVHDKDTDKASAALDVHVGHISDPVSVYGPMRDILGYSHGLYNYSLRYKV